MSLKPGRHILTRNSSAKDSASAQTPNQRVQKILATVSINLGWGQKNPVLKICNDTVVSELVSNFINQYQLPIRVHSVIMERISSQLNKENLTPNVSKANRSETPHKTNRIPKSINKKPEKLAIRTDRNQIATNNVNRNRSQTPRQTPLRLKTMNHDYSKKSISPFSRKNNKSITSQKFKCPQFKSERIDLKAYKAEKQNLGFRLTNKTTNKEPEENRQQVITCLLKLFKYLTKNNPSHVKLISPQYICFENLTPGILGILQQFFQTRSDQQLENMTVDRFCQQMQAQQLDRSIYLILTHNAH